jgi:hypothetical protein
MRLLIALAVLVCVAAAPAVPEPAPSGEPLPEIGRTRANSPACAAMRDLVVPSFAAAQRADARFAETRKRLPRYAQFAADAGSERIRGRNVGTGGAFRESELARLDSDAARLLQEAGVIKKLIADPRLAADSKDPQIQAERAQLEQLYEMQQRRAALLSEFVQRESTNLGKRNVGMEDKGGLDGKFAPAARNPDPSPQPIPLADTNGPRGMPLLSGLDIADRSRLAEWGDQIAAAVRASENEAAKTFLAIAQACR